jgi:uncharacterized protein YegL
LIFGEYKMPLALPEFVDNPEPRCPVILLCDTSGSMAGEPIKALKEGLAAFQNDVYRDEIASLRVEVALVSFGPVRLAQDFVTIDNFTPPQLTADGVTPMGEAIEYALDLLEKRKETYKTNGIQYYRPWVFLITDGAPTDSWQNAAYRVREAEAQRRLLSELFTKTIKKVRAALEEQATKDGYSVDDLACTLLVFIATPDWVVAMQIGDGFIVLRCQEEDAQLLFAPDKGEYINETTFVTSANALESMRVYVKKGKPEFICASTDGLERLAIKMSDWTPFAPFFQPLEEYLRETSNPEKEDEYLISFLDSDRLNARTDDDKTLLLCLYDSSADSR